MAQARALGSVDIHAVEFVVSDLPASAATAHRWESPDFTAHGRSFGLVLKLTPIQSSNENEQELSNRQLEAYLYWRGRDAQAASDSSTPVSFAIGIANTRYEDGAVTSEPAVDEPISPGRGRGQ